MVFADYYNIVTDIIKKIKTEENDFKKNLLSKSKKEIMVEYLELYIYTRLHFFFQYIIAQARDENYIFTIEQLQQVLSIDNFLSYIKNRYFRGETFQDRLSNTDLIEYFKK